MYDFQLENVITTFDDGVYTSAINWPNHWADQVLFPENGPPPSDYKQYPSRYVSLRTEWPLFSWGWGWKVCASQDIRDSTLISVPWQTQPENKDTHLNYFPRIIVSKSLSLIFKCKFPFFSDRTSLRLRKVCSNMSVSEQLRPCPSPPLTQQNNSQLMTRLGGEG